MTKKKSKIYGIILAGGKSTRMKKDKALLNYHGKPQLAYAYELLMPFCGNVFVSMRKDQATSKAYQKFPAIFDKVKYQNKGPLAGILSAFEKYPKSAWVVLGCDLPFVNSKTMITLFKKRDTKKYATAFKSSYDNLPEPLCAIYEPKSLKRMQKYFEDGGLCPRKFLIRNDTKLLKQMNKRSLDNVNDPQELKKVKALIKK